jgi:spore maturation protein CgeB
MMIPTRQDPPRWDKKVMTVLLQWDYGRPDRGDSLEKRCFFASLKELVATVEPVWVDELLHDRARLQQLVLAKAGEFRPDLVFFIPLGEEFSVETLERLKADGTTFAWFGDDQWRFDSFTARYAPHFTHVSTTDPWIVPRYRRLGIEPILTQWGAQPYSDRIGPLPPDEPFRYAVSFVGQCNSYRRWFIRRLAAAGIRVDCFGAGWPNGRISFEEMEQIFRTSRINLNISNSACHDIRYVFSGPRNLVSYLRSPKRLEQMKARNFEIPLAGGFQLANHVPCLDRYLQIGAEVAVYNSPEECVGQIGYYLENEGERRRVVAAGHARVSREHTYRHRLEQILGTIFGRSGEESGTS